MQARIKWVEERTFLGQSGSGHALVLDASLEVRSAVVYGSLIVVLVFVPQFSLWLPARLGL